MATYFDWRYGCDQLGQVTNGTRYWSDGSRVAGQQFGFGYDTIGNRLWATTGGDTNGANLRTQNYSANALNQYTNRILPGYVEANGSADTGAAVTVNSLTPDRQGEYYRQEISINNSASGVAQWIASRATNATGTSVVARLSFTPQTPESYTYDAAGNLTQDGLWNYTWDAENRLTRVETRTNAITDSSCWTKVDATYDFASRRLRKQVYTWNSAASAYQLSAGLRFFYRGWNLIGQLDEVTGTRLSFVWGTDLSGTMQGAGGVGGLKAMIVHNGSLAGTYFYSYDGNGNVAALVNAVDGSEAARYEYGPFLELIRVTGALAHLNPFRASTKYQDDETDLLYYGYRYLSTVTGRWLSRDPLGEQGGENLVAFVSNNPLDFLDSWGLNKDTFPRRWPKDCCQLDDLPLLKQAFQRLRLDRDYAMDGEDNYKNPEKSDLRKKGTRSPRPALDHYRRSTWQFWKGHLENFKSGCAKARKTLELFNSCFGPAQPEAAAIFAELENWVLRYCDQRPPNDPPSTPVPLTEDEFQRVRREQEYYDWTHETEWRWPIPLPPWVPRPGPVVPRRPWRIPIPIPL